MNTVQKFLTARRIRKYYDLVDGRKYYISNTQPDTKDERDLETVGVFGFFEEDYQPVNDDLNIVGQGIKDQGQFNTCGWVSVTSNREVTEEEPLAEQGLIQWAKREGLISGDGYSQLRDNCKAVQKFGIPEARFLPNTPWGITWEDYSRYSMTKEAEANAQKHRAGAYVQVTEKRRVLKILDEMKLRIHTGMAWYHDYNMRGGFSAPWSIDRAGKTLVGGHAFEISGYVKNFRNRGLHLRFPNTYTTGWGDQGYFYMPFDYAMRTLYSRWLITDMPVDTARFLQDYAGKNVRAKDGKAVYLITGGKKYAYPNWLTFLAYEGVKSEIDIVEPEMLEAVERGADMRIETSPLWPLIKEMSAPDNYKKLMELNIRPGVVGAPVEGWLLNAIFEEMLQASKS
jgi:hypothetical protein